MSLGVQFDDVTIRYGDETAVDAVCGHVRPGTITGLLGRNGAGKTTLLSAVAGYRRIAGGSVLVDGRTPFEDADVMSEVCLVRSAGDIDDGMRVDDALEVAATLRPRWDVPFAERLVEEFELRPRAHVSELSTGARSALAVVVGLAARAPLTIFDEPHLGMDAPSRYRFYELLLSDYAEHPRTIVVSTHLIGEIAPLLEEVIILHGGRVLLQDSVDSLRSAGAELTGPTADVTDLVTVGAGLSVLSSRSLGNTTATVVHGELDAHLRSEADRRGVDVTPVPLQDLFVHLTSDGVAPDTRTAPDEGEGATT